MKNTIISKSLIVAVLLCSTQLFSCSESEKIGSDLNIPNLGGADYKKTDIDLFLEAKFLKPYNIDVKYRWDSFDMQNSVIRPVTPIDERVVRPFMQAVHDVWFAPYIATAGIDFLKTYAPKKVVLVGSPEYRNGSITLGQAEGGRKILLLNVNNFDPKDPDNIREFLHTIEHEFAHIMHQTKAIDPTFEKISAKEYNPSGWTDINRDPAATNHYEPDAYKMGFISAYSASGKDEDFVEMMSQIMVYGSDWYEEKVIKNAMAEDANPDALANLRAKEAMVVEYLKTRWNIEFYDNPLTGEVGLVTLVKEAIDAVVKESKTEKSE